MAWTQKPTYQRSIITFAGYLKGNATLAQPDAESARRGGTANFTINDPNGNALGRVVKLGFGR